MRKIAAWWRRLDELLVRERKLSAALLLSLVLLLSAYLNLTGLGFGLPQLTHEDERLVAIPALNVLKFGEVIGIADNEPQYHYPHLYIYAEAGIFASAYIWEHARGNVYTLAEGEKQYYRAKIHDLPLEGWWPRLYLYGRALTAMIGVAAVALAFAVGWRLRSTAMGLTAAGALAVSPLFVANSHYITINAPAGFMALLALFVTLKLFDNPPHPLLTVFPAAVVCGLAASTKYNAGVVVFGLVLAVALTQRGIKLLRGLLLVPAGAMLGFFAGTPQALRQPTIFLQDVAQQITMKRFGTHAFAEVENPLLSYLWFLFSDGLGIGLSLLALLGLYAGVRRFRGRGLAVAAVAALFLAAMGTMRDYFTRDLAIAAPLLAVLCGFGGLELVYWACKLKLPAPRATAALAVAALALPSLLGAVGLSSILAGQNNFLAAKEWIEENLPAGSRVLMEYGSQWATIPFDEGSGFQLTRTRYVPGRPIAGLKKNFDYVITWKHGPHRIDYYALGETTYQRGGYAQIEARYGGDLVSGWEAFREEVELVKEFNPFELGTQGPTIKIWKLRGDD
jgi:4-amino-4-deoxy-L-arabinose transferase-like glycosyltransferase